MNRLDNKVVLMTGGTKGIGAATAELMCEQGAKVVVTARGEAAGRDFEAAMREKGYDLRFIVHDVSSFADWLGVVEQVESLHGKLHILVNNAAIGFHKLFVDYSERDIDQMIDINIKGVALGMQAALPLMRRTAERGESGSIVNLSTASVTNSTVGESAYNATKGAVQCLSNSLAREFGTEGYNIRVNTVNPGFVWTDMVAAAMQSHVDDGSFATIEEAKQHWIDRYYPIGRLGVPEDVAKLIIFLASNDSAFITGANYAVDGGETA